MSDLSMGSGIQSMRCGTWVTLSKAGMFAFANPRLRFQAKKLRSDHSEMEPEF